MQKLKLMAVLHKKEEKIQVVLGRLPKKYTHEEFVAMFIKLYSKDWGKIKSAYIKQSQDKEPGTIVRMPKPDLYLKQLLETYLQAKPVKIEPVKKVAVAVETETIQSEAPKKTKAPAKKKETTLEEPVKKTKSSPSKELESVEKAPAKAKKLAVAKKETTTDAPVKKTTTPRTKKVDAEVKVPAKKTKA